MSKKGEKIMKKVLVFSIIVFSLFAGLFMCRPTYLYADIDVSASIPSTATVSLLSQMSIEGRNRTTHVTVSSVAWGNVAVGTEYALPQAYILFSSTSNRKSWKIDIYTDNVPRISTDTAKKVYQAGGLYNTDALQGTTDFIRIPALWFVSGSSVDPVNVGDPSVKNSVTGSTTTADMGWMYIKDHADQDDPDTGDNESWSSAQADGYPVCLYGGAGWMNLPVGITPECPNYVYVECDFKPAVGGKDYETKIWFDLYY